MLPQLLFYLGTHKLAVFAFQHGLVPCWIANNGSFFVVVDYPCSAEISTCCNVREKRIQSNAMDRVQFIVEHLTKITYHQDKARSENDRNGTWLSPNTLYLQPTYSNHSEEEILAFL